MYMHIINYNRNTGNVY